MISITGFTDSKSFFKLCTKDQVLYEVAKYFRKTNEVCQNCGGCYICYGYNFSLGQLLFYKVASNNPKKYWEVYTNTNSVGFEIMQWDL